MSDQELAAVAEAADMIVKGYAFTKNKGFISVLNLNHPDRAMVIDMKGTMLETNMDEIEQVIVRKIWEKDAQFLEEANA